MAEGGRNRNPIQRTDQHDCSLKQTLSLSSEWQLVKLRWLAQPLLTLSFILSDLLLLCLDCSFTLIFCLSTAFGLYYSPILFSSPLSILSLCIPPIFWPSWFSSDALLCFPLQQHSHSAAIWMWCKALKCRKTSLPSSELPLSASFQTQMCSG